MPAWIEQLLIERAGNSRDRERQPGEPATEHHPEEQPRRPVLHQRKSEVGAAGRDECETEERRENEAGASALGGPEGRRSAAERYAATCRRRSRSRSIKSYAARRFGSPRTW